MEGRYGKHNHASGEREVPGSSWSFSLSSLPDSCLRFSLSVCSISSGTDFSSPRCLGSLLPNLSMHLTFVFPTLHDSLSCNFFVIPFSYPKSCCLPVHQGEHSWQPGLRLRGWYTRDPWALILCPGGLRECVYDGAGAGLALQGCVG